MEVDYRYLFVIEDNPGVEKYRFHQSVLALVDCIKFVVISDDEETKEIKHRLRRLLRRDADVSLHTDRDEAMLEIGYFAGKHDLPIVAFRYNDRFWQELLEKPSTFLTILDVQKTKKIEEFKLKRTRNNRRSRK